MKKNSDTEIRSDLILPEGKAVGRWVRTGKGMVMNMNGN